MDFSEVLRRRRMVRNYSNEPVTDEDREAVLAAALRAPSAGNTQGWSFLALADRPDVDAFWGSIREERSAGNQYLEGMRRAPLIVVPLSCKQAYLDRYAEPDKGVTDRREDFWPVPYWDIDAGFGALLMLLAAVDRGLGACFFGIVPQRVDAFRAAFGVPSDHMPIGALTIGHAAPDVPSPSLRRPRKSLDDVVHRGRW